MTNNKHHVVSHPIMHFARPRVRDSKSILEMTTDELSKMLTKKKRNT